MLRLGLTFTLLFLGLSAWSQIQSTQFTSTQKFLEDFHNNPRATYLRAPEKSGRATELFSTSEVVTGKYLQSKKDQYEEVCDFFCQNPATLFSTEGFDQGLRAIYGGQSAPMMNVHELDRMGLQKGQVRVQPWSDSYWPLFHAGIARRYANGKQISDGSYDQEDGLDGDARRRRRSWEREKRRREKQRRRCEKRRRRGKTCDMPSEMPPFGSGQTYSSSELGNAPTQRLSPAEKYDLVMGDSSYGLTRNMLNRRDRIYNKKGFVARWQGFCHGWAMASIMHERPRRSVSVRAWNGQNVTFFPSDIKGLASIMWGNGDKPIRVGGRRCYKENPARDRVGRIIDPACFDSNPGIFHVTLLDFVGKNKKPFIFDSTYDAEVWNYPIRSYQFKYYNPQTGQSFDTAREAMIDIRNFTKDKFRRYRPSEARKIVGVSLFLGYVNFTGPSARSTDSTANDKLKNVKYMYDLELDENGKIIGGEWYQAAHPDMIWAIDPGKKAYENAPQGRWGRNQSVPADWRQRASGLSRRGVPVLGFVEQLVDWSR